MEKRLKNLKSKFPRINEAKLKEGVCFGPRKTISLRTNQMFKAGQ